MRHAQGDRLEASLPLNFALPTLLTPYAPHNRRLENHLLHPQQHTETRDQPDSIAIQADNRGVSPYAVAMGAFLEAGTASPLITRLCVDPLGTLAHDGDPRAYQSPRHGRRR
jgi:hypothetical protein